MASGVWVLPAESVFAFATAAQINVVAGSDVSVARLRCARTVLRYRPNGALSGRPHPPVEQQVVLPSTPGAAYRGFVTAACAPMMPVGVISAQTSTTNPG
jgi:hypothetical protein